ncbi:MAG: hypothetical protein KF729_13110 [Sandaracinaceae bacterium]|nr:hypothetical protein [Sandaracinaceae bacterium]
MRALSSTLGLLVAAGCGGASAEPTFPDGHDPAYAASFEGERDPRVSTSRGEPGGYVVLWPRIVPAGSDEALAATAAAVQRRLVALTEEVADGAPIDVRPSPERVCPRQGCRAASVGAALLHANGRCAVVLITSPPGASRAHLDAWVGEVDILNSSPPFRDPPEEHLRVRELVPCADVAGALEEAPEELSTNIRGVRPS